MTRFALAVTVVTAVGLFNVTPAEAAKNRNRNNGEKRAARMLSRFDANNDGNLDTTEAQRVRTTFDTLKALDTDHDGKLSDSEIAAAKVAPKQGKRARKARKDNA